ncbi:class II aldolase/adducin family protein [Achromobacter aloeverae]
MDERHAGSKSLYTEREWAARCELAALYRLVAHFRMTDLIYTHISLKVPGSDDLFLVNRYGVLFHEMTASDLVKVDIEGNVHDENPESRRLNAAGFTIHSAVHMAREDIHCVIHTHTQAGIAVSAQKQGLLPISQHSLRFHKALGYHDYEGFAVDLDERKRLATDLGAFKAMILRNHGLLTVGETAAEAFSYMFFLERACQVQIAAQSGGAELVYPAQDVMDHTASQWQNRGAEDWYYKLFWDACLQTIHDQQNDYCR